MWLVNAILYSTLTVVSVIIGTAIIHLAAHLDAPTQRASIVMMSPQDGPNKGRI
jgi:hypothetical protein